MRGDALVLMQDLDRRRRGAHVDALLDERARHAVAPVVEYDAVVEPDADVELPFGELVACGWQRLHRRTVDRLERAATAAVEALGERARVEPLEQLGDRGVELVEAEEGAVAQAREHPALGDLHTDLDFRLVARLSRARRDDRAAVVAAELRERRVDLRLVATRHCDGASKLVGHDHRADRAEVLERVDRRADEVAQLLGARRLRIRVIRGTQDRDVQLDLDQLARGRVDQMRLLAREVDERLFARAMDLSHRWLVRPAIARVGVAELTVLIGAQRIATRAGGSRVLLPKQVHRHTDATHLAVDPRHVNGRASSRRVSIQLAKESLLDLALGEVLGLLPAQADLLRASDVVTDGRLAQPDRHRDLAHGSAVLETHPQYLFDLSHR